MPQYKASHEMDGRKRKEEQHAAFGAAPMQPYPPPQQQPNGMRPNVPIPSYGAPPPIPAYNGGQVAAPPHPPPVGVFNGPPPATMAAHGYPGPQQQQPPPQMGGYGAAGPGPSGMAAGMGMGGGGFRPPPQGGHNQNHSYAAAGPPIAAAGGGMQPRRMGPGAGQYEGMRQGPSWNPHANLPARPGPPAKVNLLNKFKKQ